MQDYVITYLLSFLWCILGSVAVGVGIIIALKLFNLSTRKIDEWELIGKGNIAMAIVLAAVIIALGLVVSSAVHP